MIVGKVISAIVSTSKHSDLHGHKLLLIEPQFHERKDCFVVTDNVGAGVGQIVLVNFNNNNVMDNKVSVDATVVGIVDNAPIIKGERQK